MSDTVGETLSEEQADKALLDQLVAFAKKQGDTLTAQAATIAQLQAEIAAQGTPDPRLAQILTDLKAQNSEMAAAVPATP